MAVIAEINDFVLIKTSPYINKSLHIDNLLYKTINIYYVVYVNKH